MSFIELVLLGVGLSMDAFAVSITDGMTFNKVTLPRALSIALCFGGFQALMPTLGFFGGSLFYNYITSLDHWLALVLLSFLGGRMIVDAAKEHRAKTCRDEGNSLCKKDCGILWRVICKLLLRHKKINNAVADGNGAKLSFPRLTRESRGDEIVGSSPTMTRKVEQTMTGGADKNINNFDAVADGNGANLSFPRLSRESRGDSSSPAVRPLSPQELFMQGIATSIDALAVGVSLAAVKANIARSALIIGATTFSICLPAVYLGKKTGDALNDKAQLVGGCILIGIGLRIFIADLLAR